MGSSDITLSDMLYIIIWIMQYLKINTNFLLMNLFINTVCIHKHTLMAFLPLTVTGRCVDEYQLNVLIHRDVDLNTPKLPLFYGLV